MKLQEFDFKGEYVKGEASVIVDFLSRASRCFVQRWCRMARLCSGGLWKHLVSQ